MKEINLEEILKDNCVNIGYLKQKFPNDAILESDGHRILSAMRDLCKQLLELASENVEFTQTTSEELNSKDYMPFITADDDTIWTYSKQSITDTINQVK